MYEYLLVPPCPFVPQGLNFAATRMTKFRVSLTCDGMTRTTGTMDLATAFQQPATFGPPSYEVIVG